ncbi:iron-containing alcohol dehydrogenase [Amycolatopsis nalaikhensis]|uniref:Iron-containing alcohol dehydrogenase n=1 Tax=Amycolatopsis nalaikhensis TaxID=715472 RepID=A0ABY8XAM9_9PSEU|nr:iron-containing alcohol dehydrogenase [Amycolatopsis sp. 2-2]WIV52960.1 iron-containing alcohol dehydrogenase [Amycolatopsis sp. 2-2]
MRRANEVVLWECGTRVYAGEDVWRAMSGAAPRSRTMLVVSAGFAAANFQLVETLRIHLGIDADWVWLVQAPGTVEKAEELARSLDRVGAEGVVAVGGSSVLDLTKLACRHLADERILPAVRARGARRGMIKLPAESSVQLHRTFVPTTIGTAAAVRPFASIVLRGHRRLVDGPGLVPDIAVVDSTFTGSLPPQSIVEGISASVMRAADWYVADENANALTEAETQTVVGLLVPLGMRAGKDGLPARDRLLASYADMAQFGLPFAGHQPVVTASEAVAAEVAFETGAHPGGVLAALLPTMWQAVDDGDGRLGSRVRLRRVWDWIRAAGSPGWPEEPGPGVAAMFRSWKLGSGLECDAAAVSAAGVRALRFWEADVPALAGRSAPEVARWVRDAVLAEVRN